MLDTYKSKDIAQECTIGHCCAARITGGAHYAGCTNQHLSIYNLVLLTNIVLSHYCSVAAALSSLSDSLRQCAAATEPSTAVHTTDTAAGTTLTSCSIAAPLLILPLLLLQQSCASTTARPPDFSAASIASVRAVAGVQCELRAAVYATAAPRVCSSSTDTYVPVNIRKWRSE
jgi:hypothetical protein